MPCGYIFSPRITGIFTEFLVNVIECLRDRLISEVVGFAIVVKMEVVLVTILAENGINPFLLNRCKQ